MFTVIMIQMNHQGNKLIVYNMPVMSFSLDLDFSNSLGIMVVEKASASEMDS